MQLTNRQAAIIYNIGALLSYVSLVMLLLDAVHVAHQHQAVTLTRFGFAMSWLIGAVLKAPYKWDRLWLRVSALVQIVFLPQSAFSISQPAFIKGAQRLESPAFKHLGRRRDACPYRRTTATSEQV